MRRSWMSFLHLWQMPAFLIATSLFATGMFAMGCNENRITQAPKTAEVAGPVWFEDVTEQVGLDFVHDAGATGEYFMPQSLGSGAALLDFDNDQRLDVYLIQNGDPSSNATNCLYRQTEDGRFVDVSDGCGLNVAGRGMGATCGDLNNDGYVDLLLTEYGRARLFMNQRDNTFVDVTESARIDNPAWGTSAACVDYDHDGWLDLLIVNYLVYSPTRVCSDDAGRRDFCGPNAFPGSESRLFRNLGAAESKTNVGAVRFEDVTITSGLASQPGPGLGVVCADFTGDRWPDIFIANDGKPNHLWVNQRDGTFHEEAVVRGLAYNGMGQAQADMGVAIGDVDDDGLFDLFVTHLTDETHTYWKQGPVGVFSDRTGVAGLASAKWRSTGFGTIMADFDCDGALDLSLANGRVKFLDGPSPSGSPFWDVYRQRNQIFKGDGDHAFHDISESNHAICGRPAVARGMAVGDVDSDGALDLLVTYIAEPARLFRNVASQRGHWLTIKATDPNLGGRDVYGAVVRVQTENRQWTALVNACHSYICASDPRCHFGLGAVERVDSIDIEWPDGTDERFAGGAVDRFVTVRKGEGTSVKVGDDE